MFNKQRSMIQQLTSWLFVDLLPGHKKCCFRDGCREQMQEPWKALLMSVYLYYVWRKTQQAVSDLVHPLADLPKSNKSLPVCCVSSLVEEVGHAYVECLSRFCWKLLSFTGLAVRCMCLRFI